MRTLKFYIDMKNYIMLKELKSIREELMTGVEDKDLLFIKMQINRIDTIIYNLVKNGNTVKRELLIDYNEHVICKYELHPILDGEVDDYLNQLND